jgi:hypothetical protein
MTVRWPMSPLGEIAELVRRPVEVDIDGLYPELGVRSFGRGAFHKAPLTGADAGSKRLFRIERGDLVFNIVFAWEGAVAVAGPDDHGRFGSHRFLTFVPDPKRAEAGFIKAWFSTPAGLDILGRASPGGAGRNRTLGIEAARRMPVPVPPIGVQRWIVERLDAIEERRRELAALRTAIANDLGLLRQRAIASILSQIEAKPLPLVSLLREPPRNGHSTRPDGDSSGVPMLRISAATSRDDGAVDLTDFRRTTLQPQEVVRLGLVADDLLACRFNGNAHFTGRFAIVREIPSEPTIYPDKLIRFRVDRARVDPRYVQILMNNGACRSAVEALCQTTAGNIGLSASKLAEVSLPVPPLHDQHAVVERVQAVETQIHQARNSGAEAASELDQLLPAVLAEAFGSG